MHICLVGIIVLQYIAMHVLCVFGNEMLLLYIYDDIIMLIKYQYLQSMHIVSMTKTHEYKLLAGLLEINQIDNETPDHDHV